jgi:hypothetical protein
MIKLLITSNQDTSFLIAEMYVDGIPLADITKSETSGKPMIRIYRITDNFIEMEVKELINAIEQACRNLEYDLD